VVRLLLSHGTTTASYFATIHKEASLALAEECEAQGQRALVGKVTMTRHAPDDLLQV
jgi:guanine deaminase